MKRILISTLVVFAFLYTGMIAQQATSNASASISMLQQVKKNEMKTPQVKPPKKAPKPKVPVVGTVINFVTYAMGGTGLIEKAEAEKIASEGSPIVLLVETPGKPSKVYFVFNMDGSFAGKKLAQMAGQKKVSIIGTSGRANGFSTIVAESIQAAD